MRDGHVGRNVASLASAPRVPEREYQPITQAQAKAILEAMRGDRLEALFTVALACGLRQGEALALRWTDVDLETASISIQRTLQRIEKDWKFMEPKTRSSRRTITVPDPVVKSLREHRARQAEERLMMGGDWQGGQWGNLVFTNRGGDPLSGFHVGRRFRALLKLEGLPKMRYHDLRHGAASLLAAMGVPPRVAMEMLGHADISTTMRIYAHIAPEYQKDAAQRITNVLWGEG
ncbi:MAG: integrase [Chloroflexi bacterium]|nr:MAG: integrase [Chloroflexota bacterium]